MSDMCAYCDHERRSHWHYAGAGLRPGGHGKCLIQGCSCERYAEDQSTLERHEKWIVHREDAR